MYIFIETYKSVLLCYCIDIILIVLYNEMFRGNDLRLVLCAQFLVIFIETRAFSKTFKALEFRQ